MAIPPLDVRPGSDNLETFERKVEQWSNLVAAESNTSIVQSRFGVLETKTDAYGTVTFPHGMRGNPDGLIVTPMYPGYIAGTIADVNSQPGSQGLVRVTFSGLLYVGGPPVLTLYAMANELVKFSWHAFILRK